MSDDKHDPFAEVPPADDLLEELGSLKELLDEEHEAPQPHTAVNEIESVEEYLRLKQEAEAAGVSIEEYMLQQASETLEISAPEEDEVPLLDEVYIVEESGSNIEAEEEEVLPSPADATTVDEYFAAVAAAREQQSELPVLDEVDVPPTPDEAIPVPDEVIAGEEAIPVLEEVVVDDDAIPELDEVFDTEEAIPLLDEAVGVSHAPTAETLSLEEVQGLVELIVERKLQRLKPALEKEVMEELKRLLPIASFSQS